MKNQRHARQNDNKFSQLPLLLSNDFEIIALLYLFIIEWSGYRWTIISCQRNVGQVVIDTRSIAKAVFIFSRPPASATENNVKYKKWLWLHFIIALWLILFSSSGSNRWPFDYIASLLHLSTSFHIFHTCSNFVWRTNSEKLIINLN